MDADFAVLSWEGNQLPARSFSALGAVVSDSCF